MIFVSFCDGLAFFKIDGNSATWRASEGEGSRRGGPTRRAPRTGNAGLSGTIFDQAAGLENTQATLEDAGVADRCTLVAGDFLTDPLPAERGAYVVKSVLCDWGDDDVVRILRSCRQAMCADSTLFVIDMVLPEGDTTPDPVALMSDLCTLARGGAIRTEKEFGALFAEAGLRPVEISGGQPGTHTNILRAVKI